MTEVKHHIQTLVDYFNIELPKLKEHYTWPIGQYL